jgi:hypothetical protein
MQRANATPHNLTEDGLQEVSIISLFNVAPPSFGCLHAIADHPLAIPRNAKRKAARPIRHAALATKRVVVFRLRLTFPMWVDQPMR